MSTVDVKCPHCNAWLTDCPDLKPTITHTDYGFILKCGHCDLHSYWNCTLAPVPLQCDHHGSPNPGVNEVREL